VIDRAHLSGPTTSKVMTNGIKLADNMIIWQNFYAACHSLLFSIFYLYDAVYMVSVLLTRTRDTRTRSSMPRSMNYISRTDIWPYRQSTATTLCQLSPTSCAALPTQLTWSSVLRCSRSADLRDPICSDESFRCSLKTFLFAKY